MGVVDIVQSIAPRAVSGHACFWSAYVIVMSRTLPYVTVHYNFGFGAKLRSNGSSDLAIRFAVALMENQVANLRKRNIPCDYLSSARSAQV